MMLLNKNSANPLSRKPRVIAITGGKGGVGKTSISVNLAIALARTGFKVCLFDADLGLANINVMLGLHPANTLEHLFTGEKTIQEILLTGPEGIHIVPGASGFAQCVELDARQQQRLVSAIRAIEPDYDYLLVDTAAGIAPAVLHFIAACQVAAVVVTPEPTSLTDAFSLLKVLKRRGYRRSVQIIVNMAAGAAQAEKVYRRFSTAVMKYLELTTEYLGSVWKDESMRTAIMLQRPVALFPKNDPSARSFYRLAEAVDDVFSRSGVPRLAFSAYWQKLIERQADKLAQVPTLPLSTSFAPVPGGGARAETAEPLRRELSVSPTAVSPLPQDTDEDQAIMVADSVTYMRPLSSHSDDQWVDLRVRLQNFMRDDNTTPEQLTTLLTSCLSGIGSRLGGHIVEVLHALLLTINPQQLNEEQRQLLVADVERLGLMESKRPEAVTEAKTVPQDNFRSPEQAKERYDSAGFGCQKSLAAAIRSASDGVPLEDLLESIKYASMVDSSDE